VTQPRGADLTPQLSGRSLLGFLRRWGLLVEPRSVLPLVVPTAQVDRFYPRSELDIWGCTSDYLTSAAGRWPASMLLAGPRALVVRRIEACCNREDFVSITSQFTAHLFSPPLEQYNPVEFDPGAFFPFFATRAALTPNPGAVVVTGYQTGIATVIVNGLPVSLLGPRYYLAAGLNTDTGTLLDFTDPPIVIHPFQALCVQSLFPRQGLQDIFLAVNWYWSEIEDEGL
jgi:hypothetical protein